MNFLELTQKRFSARKFTTEPVSQEDLDDIMECVRLAPSACEGQPLIFIILRCNEDKEKLRCS